MAGETCSLIGRLNSLIGGINSLFDGFISLFGRLGNLSDERKKIKDLPERSRS
jgi:hypothetical protein